MPIDNYDYLVKFIIVGNTAVGKSCLHRVFIEKQFIPDHNITIGVEFGSRMLKIGDKMVKLQLWDTSGQENFRSITRAYYRGSIGILLVYGINCRQSFNDVKFWLEDVRKHINDENMVMMLIGNKSDLEAERRVSYEEAASFAKQNNLLFMEVSAAKSSTLVDSVFVQMATEINERVKKSTIRLPPESMGVRLTNSQSEPGNEGHGSSTCC